MSDQASLPVTFPPGTELPVKGKVEVTNEVHVKVMNAEIPVTVVGEVPVKVTNTPKVEVSNTPHVEVTNVPEVKLAAASAVEVTKGKIEVTNTVKVEGVAASPVALINGAAAGEVSINQKRLLITSGEKRTLLKTVGEATKYTIAIPTSANATWKVQSVFALWEEKLKEKTAMFIKFEIEDVTEKVLLFFQTYFMGEVAGAGEKIMKFTVSFMRDACPPPLLSVSAINVSNENNMWVAYPLPEISGGIGVSLSLKLSILQASPVGTAIKTELKTANTVYITNEGTL